MRGPAIIRYIAGGLAIDVKRLLLLSLVLFAVPVASMAYLGGVALDADQLARVELERDKNRVVAREVLGVILRDYAIVEEDVFEACQQRVVPALLAGDFDRARTAMAGLESSEALIDRFFVEDPEDRLDLPRSEPPYTSKPVTVDEVHPSIALAFSLEDSDPLRAEQIYLALRTGGGGLADEAKVELSALYFRQGRWEEARESLRGLVDVPARPRALGLPVPLEAAFLLAYIQLGSGEAPAAGELLAATARDLLDGRFRVNQDQFEGAWRKLKETLEPVDPQRWAGLVAAREARFQEIAFAEEIRAKVLSVVGFGASAELQFEHVSRHGEENRLYAYCHVPRPGAAPLLLGFRVDLHGVTAEIAAPRLDTLRAEGHTILLVDSADRTVDGKRPARREISASEGFAELFPFWRIEVLMGGVRRNTGLSHSILGLLAMATASVGVCFFAVYKFVTKSSELSSLRDEFISNVTHELKTPLTSIRMFSEMLTLGRVKNEARRKEYYRFIHEEANRLHQLVQNILAFSRMEAGRQELELVRGDLRPLLEETIDLFRFSQKGCSFEATIEDELPQVSVDRDALSSAVLNLLTNAVKYSRDNKDVKLRAYVQDDTVRVEVSDRGIGIDSAELPLIFDRYYRSKANEVKDIAGSGLGLSLVKYITEAHGGHVAVHSRPGEGSTFTLVIPVSESVSDG